MRLVAACLMSLILAAVVADAPPDLPLPSTAARRAPHRACAAAGGTIQAIKVEGNQRIEDGHDPLLHAGAARATRSTPTGWIAA